MTRHNLAIHISWLLSSEVTPPVGVHQVPVASATVLTASAETIYADSEEEDIEEQDPSSLPSPSPNRRTAPAVNVAAGIQRPPPPPKVTPNPPLQERLNNIADESMGKLSSASRPTRPGLVSQQQPATPASTTGSTSSLMQGFATFLRAKNDTPSSNSAIDRIQTNVPRYLQTPQTPRHTPRTTSGLKIDTVESVDLTGDDYGQDPSSRSSSTEIVYGEPKVLWTEAHALRPEPVPRSTKKRKSNEMSKGSSPRKDNKERSPRKAKRVERAESEEFMDIDDAVALSQPPSRPRFNESRPQSVKPSIEQSDTENNFEEEYSVTETVSRVETRTRKSISRAPSGCNASTNVPGLVSPRQLACSPSKNDSPSRSKPRSIIQVTASPMLEFTKHPPSQSHQTPQKPRKFRQERIIQDSDDEDMILDGKDSSNSPQVPVRSSPRVVDSPGSPKRKAVPTFESTDLKGKEVANSKLKVSSPLRPISRNIGTKQENVPSPFQKDSPTRLPPQQKQADQDTPSSTLPPDEKKIVSFFLKTPSTIISYSTRIESSLAQNSVLSMELMDEGKTAPAALKEERKALLDMKKAYEFLSQLAERHRAMVAEKRELVRKISELWDIDADVSAFEERSSSLTKEIRKIEQETGQLLHTSGAIEDGFGTRADFQNNARPLGVLSSKSGSDLGSLPPRSSALSSAQIIFQTQFPTLPTANSSHGGQDPAHSSRVGFELVPNSFDPGHRSLSSVRMSPSRTAVERPQASNPPTTSTSGLKQPNFYRDPPPMDYDFGGDNGLEGLIEDAEQFGNSASRNEMPDDVTDDYGGFDDDDDLLGIAQEIEQRHSLGGGGSGLPRMPSFETTSATPEPPKRTRPSPGKDMYSHVESKADLYKYSWSKDVRKALKDRFKLNGFRHHQLEAINATLGGNDAFVLMPTGGGKSLCYQLPAVVQSGKTKGVTVVISPLLSLMTDQVAHLRDLHIQAATLNSEVSSEERSEIMSCLRESHPEHFIQLLYITPEMINKSQAILNALSGLHRNKRLARIVIDEAHCVSQWGHDFRPDYVALGEVRARFPGVPFMALTATATENVKIDVMHNLHMEKATPFSQSFNRPNLHYEVRSKVGKSKVKEFLDDVAELIKSKYPNQTGIIYTLSRNNCEQLAEKLAKEYKIKAHWYHAAMSPEQKKQVQLDWQKGKIKVVVATIAFGMGIDKADVRFVVHHTIPKTLEGYYQETGRAGRDGKTSGCYLYYGYQDTKVLKDFIFKGEGSHDQKERQRQMLSSIVHYCENRADCRRVQVLAYFGEVFSKAGCNATCDNCKSRATFKEVDFTPQARAAMSIVKHTEDSNVTLLHCVDVLRGANSIKKKNMGHENLKEFGVAKDTPRGDVERVFYRLLMENALGEHSVMNRSGFASQYVNLGPNCRDFMQGPRKVKMQIKISDSPTAPAPAPARETQKKAARKPAKSATAAFSSTLLTSPLTDATSRRKPASRRREGAADGRGYMRDDLVASDNDDGDDDDDDESFFEPVQGRNRREETPQFGAPITADERMANLPAVHRAYVENFVDAANKEMEEIRNLKGLKKPIFTEANLRDMAIYWTTTLDDMEQISNINPEAVKNWGKKFLPTIRKFSAGYDEAMNNNQNRDLIYKNVIDLVTEDEDEEDEDEDEYGMNDSDEEAILQAEKGSKYFPNATSSNKQGQSSRTLPWTGGASSSKAAAPRKAYGRGGVSFRGRGRKKASGRRSGSSASGQSYAGAKRKTWGPAKPSVAAKKAGAAKGSGVIYAAFGNQGSGRGGGSGMGGGGGIRMMPT